MMRWMVKRATSCPSRLHRVGRLAAYLSYRSPLVRNQIRERGRMRRSNRQADTGAAAGAAAWETSHSMLAIPNSARPQRFFIRLNRYEGCRSLLVTVAILAALPAIEHPGGECPWLTAPTGTSFRAIEAHHSI